MSTTPTTSTETLARIAELWVFPVKSMAGTKVESAEIR